MVMMNTIMAVVPAVAVVLLLTAVEAQQQVPSSPCSTAIQSTLPCWRFDIDINATATPSDQCCGAFKTAVKTQLPCMCNFYVSASSYLAQANITGNLVLDVASKCGIANSTLTSCKASGDVGGGAGAAAGAGGAQPGAANVISSNGFIGLVAALFLIMMFY